MTPRTDGGDDHERVEGDAGADADVSSAVMEPGGGSPDPTSAGHPAVRGPTTVIARTTVRLVVPVILVASVALLLQGHNLPGGGFIGAVLTATAFVLVYVVFGIESLADVVVPRDDADGRTLISGYNLLLALGLALAAGAGLVPVVLGHPFLTQGVWFLDGLPLYGTLEVASALAFDLGVYFTVVGALLVVVAEVGSE